MKRMLTNNRPVALMRAALVAGILLPAGAFVPSASAAFAQTPAPAAAPAQPATTISAEFRQVLEKSGTFIKHERYGEVWKPNVVDQNWKPYPECLWTYKKDTGWYLDDPSDWGQIVHHYGRWTMDNDQGWLWVAGSEFSPGWVVWDNTPGKVGWAPKMPEIDEKEIEFKDYKESGLFQYVDAAKFGQGCKPARAPIVSAPPPPPRFSSYALAPRVSSGYVSGGGYTGGGYVSGGYVTGGWTGGGWTGGHICKFKPWLPKCNWKPGNFCKKFPAHPKCKFVGLPPACSKGIKPAWCAPICKTQPWRPMCKIGWKKKMAGKNFAPGKLKPGKLVRPGHIRPGHLRPGHLRPHRPGLVRPHVRPHRPIYRPHRPHFGRPHVRPSRIVRPHRPVYRPGRQHFQRPAFRPARAQFRPARSFQRGPAMRQRVSGSFRGRRF